jgi:repressor LexA
VEGLSPRQVEVLDFIRAWIDQHGVPPTFREIGDHLDIRSTNGVSDHVRALERKGYIDRAGASGSARCLRLTQRARGQMDEQRVVGIPVLGRIAAGVPIPAVEDAESALLVDRGLLPTGGDLFALIIRGDSMIDDGIHDGDYVFVRRAPTCRDGEIAAVLVDGEATVKRLYRERNRVRLQPANPDMDPIYVPNNAPELAVMGVVVGVYRRVH